MSHRTKSGPKRDQHKHKQRWKRKMKRQKAALIAAGTIKKGVAPVAAV